MNFVYNSMQLVPSAAKHTAACLHLGSGAVDAVDAVDAIWNSVTTKQTGQAQEEEEGVFSAAGANWSEISAFDAWWGEARPPIW